MQHMGQEMRRSRGRRLGLGVVVLGLALSASHCATWKFRMVEHGTIETSGVEIIAEDGSFRLTAGTPFKPPGNGFCMRIPNTTTYFAFMHGLKRVRVVYPGLAQPLYGLLGLCKVPAQATGPATRSYLIRIPRSYVDATTGGRVSLVYETTNMKVTASSGKTYYWPAWELWLSRRPFPTHYMIKNGRYVPARVVR